MFKTKQDAYREIKRYKIRFVANVYTKKKGIDYDKTFSIVLLKDLFQVVMAMVSNHFFYKLCLHTNQMDFKTSPTWCDCYIK